MGMVLVVIDKVANLSQFVMWASVEFAMQYNAQYEKFVRGRAIPTTLPPVLDLATLGTISGMADGDVLYMVGHGNAQSTKMWAGPFDGSEKTYEFLGGAIGAHVKGKKIVVHCGACFAAAGDASSGLNKIAKSLASAGATGITVKGFKGATVTNIASGPTAVVNTAKMSSAQSTQDTLIGEKDSGGLTSQQRLDSWRSGHTTASAHEIAEANMTLNWGFFQKFSYDPSTDKMRDFYLPFPSVSAPTTGAEEISVTS